MLFAPFISSIMLYCRLALSEASSLVLVGRVPVACMHALLTGERELKAGGGSSCTAACARIGVNFSSLPDRPTRPSRRRSPQGSFSGWSVACWLHRWRRRKQQLEGETGAGGGMAAWRRRRLSQPFGLDSLAERAALVHSMHVTGLLHLAGTSTTTYI